MSIELNEFGDPIRGVIFDMDGCLLDSERFVRTVYQRTASGIGWHIGDSLFEMLLGRTHADVKRQLEKHFGADFPLGEFIASVEEVVSAHSGWESLVKCGARNLLDYLRNVGLPTAVATSSSKQVALMRLESAGLLRYFDVVVGGDEVERGKPEPEIFLEAAKRLDIPPSQCLVFEDSVNGIEAASSADMRVIHVVDLQNPTPRTREFTCLVVGSLVEVPLSVFASEAILDDRPSGSFATKIARTAI